jgi:hypothetical protein
MQNRQYPSRGCRWRNCLSSLIFPPFRINDNKRSLPGLNLLLGNFNLTLYGYPPLCGRREPCDLPLCRRGSLRIMAAITQESVMTRILRHLQLASVPPPIAPARLRQEIFVFDEAHASVGP